MSSRYLVSVHWAWTLYTPSWKCIAFLRWVTVFLSLTELLFHNSTYNTAAQCQIWWNFHSKNVNEASAVQVSTKVAFSKFEWSQMFSFWKLLSLAENRCRSQRLKNSLIVISSDLYLCDDQKRSSRNKTFLTTQLTGKSSSYFTYVMGSVTGVLYYCYGTYYGDRSSTYWGTWATKLLTNLTNRISNFLS